MENEELRIENFEKIVNFIKEIIKKILLLFMNQFL